MQDFGLKCQMCGEKDIDVLVIHHKDGNRKNNKPSNKIVLCSNCHARVHKGNPLIINFKTDSSLLDIRTIRVSPKLKKRIERMKGKRTYDKFIRDMIEKYEKSKSSS